MAGKGRKAAQHVEEDNEERSEPSVDMQAVMKLILEGNEKAEARRLADALELDKRAEARRVADAKALEVIRLAEIKRAAADKLGEEERAEARRIAAEERAEARKRADKIAEEERAELRAEARRVRELEKRAAEEMERAREESARIASEKLLEQQEAMGARQYAQQIALMKMQAEIGEKAANAHRLEQTISRKRDRAVASIPNYRESDDIEDFLITAERKLRAGEIPEGEWLTTIASKLNGKMGSSWQDLCVSMDDYNEVKSSLLKVCGYTPKIAGEVFFGFKPEHTKGMTADQLYHRGMQLVRRMVAPLKLTEALEFAILRPWVCASVSKKARMVLDARSVNSAIELIDALQDHLVMEGDRTEGQAAVFKKQTHGSEGGGERKVSGANCFKCGKPGHKAFECWQGKGSSGGSGSYKGRAQESPVH